MALQPSAPACPLPGSLALNPSNPSPSCCFPSAGTTATTLVNASTRIHARRQRRRRGSSTTSNSSNNTNQSSLLLACLRKSARRQTTSPSCRPIGSFTFPALPSFPAMPTMPTMPTMPSMPAMPSMPSIPSWPTLASLDLLLPSVISGSWGTTRHEQQQQQQQDRPCPCCPPADRVPTMKPSTTRDTATRPRPRGRDFQPAQGASGESESSVAAADDTSIQRGKRHSNPSNWPTAYTHVKLKMVEQHQRNWEAISQYCEQVDLWHHDESAFGEHEYDRERVTEQRSQRPRPQPFHHPTEHITSPSLVAYRMNQQHPCEQTRESTHDLAKSLGQRPQARGREQVQCSMAAAVQSQSKPVFVSVSAHNPCAPKCSACPHTKEPIAVAFGDDHHTQSFSVPGVDMATVSDMDVQAAGMNKKSTSNGASSRRINGQIKARDRDLRKSMSRSPPLSPSRSTAAGGAMLKKDSRFGVEAQAEGGQQQQQEQDGHGLEAHTQGSNEPGPDSESHMARERNFMISLSCSRCSCSLDKVADGCKTDGNAPTMALSFSLPSSTSLPPNSPLSSLPIAPSVVFIPSLSPTPSAVHDCPPCRPHSPLQPPSSPTKDASSGNMPVVTLPSVTTRPPIPKQQPGSESVPSPHELALSLPMTLQSRTDLNRLLDSVLDHATRIAESQSPPTKDCHDKTRSTPDSSMSQTVQPPPVSRDYSSKVRFFVESDDDDNDTVDEEEVYETRGLASASVARSLNNDADCEESEPYGKKDDDYCGKRWQSNCQDRITGGNLYPQYEPAAPVRRQSLLSDLFMAEKMLAAQRASSTKHSTAYWIPTSLSSGPSSRCHSAGNSDGESSYSNASPRPQVHTPKHTAPPTGLASNRPSFSQERASRGYMEDHEPLLFPELERGGEEQCKVRSPLMRSKRVFRNLDDLAEQHRVSFLNNDDGGNLIHRNAPFRPRRPTIRPGDAGPPRLDGLISKSAALSSSIAPASIFSTVPASSDSNINIPTLTAAESCRCKTPIVPLSSTKLNQVRGSTRSTLSTPSSVTATGFNKTSKVNVNSNGHPGVVSLCDSTSGCCVPATVAATTTATSALATSASTTAAVSPSTAPRATATETAKSVIGGMLHGWERATQAQGQIQLMYAHMADVVQRTLSVGSTAAPLSTSKHHL